jgi:hypothetical protein
MAGRTQSDALEYLGVSYPQLIDYASKGNTATLVSSTHDPQTVRSDRRRSKSVLWY